MLNERERSLRSCLALSLFSFVFITFLQNKTNAAHLSFVSSIRLIVIESFHLQVRTNDFNKVMSLFI